jgi:hypothetical protein
MVFFIVLCSYLFMRIHSVFVIYTDILPLFNINTAVIYIKPVYRILRGTEDYFKHCKTSDIHGGDYEECRLLEYEKLSWYFTGDTLRLR